MKPLRSLIIPVAVLMIGTGAALATSTSESAEAMLEKGYRYDSVSKKCILTDVNCSTVPNLVCTWTGGQPLYRFDSSHQTMCGIQLYQP